MVTVAGLPATKPCAVEVMAVAVAVQTPPLQVLEPRVRLVMVRVVAGSASMPSVVTGVAGPIEVAGRLYVNVLPSGTPAVAIVYVPLYSVGVTPAMVTLWPAVNPWLF